jgi:hypothetical protein
MKLPFQVFRKWLLIFISALSFVFQYQQSFARDCHLRVSLITIGVGDDLYATFGHSAIRVTDSSTGGDYVFNYGTFNFETPHFYWKFVRGKLMYSLSAMDFRDFMEAYREEQRPVTEQVLDLSCAEKEMIRQFLQRNYLPENRDYKYDFLYDNCSTRISDIFEKTLGPGWEMSNIIPEEGLTFREIINRYLKDKPWERLGINIMFGKSTDEAMTNRQIMFLPDYLMKGAYSSRLNGKPFVAKEAVLYTPQNSSRANYPFYLHPLLWLTLLAVVVILLSFNRQAKASRVILPWVDRCLFFLTGLLGCFLLFMWFGTDHKVCRWNYNLFWAFPFNLLFSFYLPRRSRGVKRYAALVLLMNLFLLLSWFVLPQQMLPDFIPVIAMLAVRAWGIWGRK